jgi:hypothetical protein
MDFCLLQRGLSSRVQGIQVRAPPYQKFSDGGLAAMRRGVQCRRAPVAVRIVGIDLSAGVKEDHSDFRMAFPGGVMQRRASVAVARRNKFGVYIEQTPNRRCITRFDGLEHLLFEI